ncbi:hypothetical protein H4219_001129 [Mycoemilia scoparia]|uniref:S1 motif domain-containing protein n=1 Tax=Mycoemilia scoparia TaxID=417184 RepID=A0A9W8A911_9FUNG|nr:hypothetical protein H4219_001129 [Mycoemilia scoparia]
MADQVVTPGRRLGSLQDLEPGYGTYVRNGMIFSSVLGIKKTSKSEDTSKKNMVYVEHNRDKNVVPDVGSEVIGQVTKISSQYAAVAIMMVGTAICREDFRGDIRIQDVRATEKDKVQIHTSFRPGDIIRAEVISLGDQRSYYLSTAKNEYGVIFATSSSGNTMLPISWQEMQDPITGEVVNRKCAKPF